MIKIEDIRIGQDVFYLDHDNLQVASFVVKGIKQGYDEDDYLICSELRPNSSCCDNIEKFYMTFPEAALALDEYCTKEIKKWEKRKLIS